MPLVTLSIVVRRRKYTSYGRTRPSVPPSREVRDSRYWEIRLRSIELRHGIITLKPVAFAHAGLSTPFSSNATAHTLSIGRAPRNDRPRSVAHRLATIQRADPIVVMADGRIGEPGIIAAC